MTTRVTGHEVNCQVVSEKASNQTVTWRTCYMLTYHLYINNLTEQMIDKLWHEKKKETMTINVTSCGCLWRTCSATSYY